MNLKKRRTDKSRGITKKHKSSEDNSVDVLPNDHISESSLNSTLGLETSKDLNQSNEEDLTLNFSLDAKPDYSICPFTINRVAKISKPDHRKYLLEETRKKAPTEDEKERFRQLFNLKFEKASIRAPTKGIKCPIESCIRYNKGRGINSKRTLIEHIGPSHYTDAIRRKFLFGVRNKYETFKSCVICKKALSSPRALLAHITIVHDALEFVMEQDDFRKLIQILEDISTENTDQKFGRDLTGWNFSCPVEDCFKIGEAKLYIDFAVHYLKIHEIEKVKKEYEIDLYTKICSICDLQPQGILRHHIQTHDGMTKILGKEGYENLIRNSDRRLNVNQIFASVVRPK